MVKNKSFFVTTPIYYINDLPHIGHAYATIAADILARYHRLIGDQTFFLTGTDENSQKTVLAAEKAGKSIQNYTDEMAKHWQQTWKNLGISNDDFIRTTQERHKKIVREIFEKIDQKGDLYKGRYEGLYCIGHEAFLKEEDLDKAGLCPDHKTKPEKLTEENYFFKLSKYEKPLLKHFEKNPDFVQPKERYNEVVSFLKSGLQDISVTRQNQKWGIPAPNDPSQVIYVWFDALINYISAAPDKWPADLHIIGKDILRFHAVIWPAILLSVNLPLPKKIFAHGFFTIAGQKISKSLGNAIDPLKITEEFGIDALRYFLFKEIPFGHDGDFSIERLKKVYNSDLANGLGNLVARVAKLCAKSDLQFALDTQENPLTDPSEKVVIYLNQLDFKGALDTIWKEVSETDQMIEKERPWELLSKDKKSAERLLNKLVLKILRIAFFLEPFMPTSAEAIKKQFYQMKISPSNILFPRK